VYQEPFLRGKIRMSLFKLNESAGSGFVEGIRWMGCNFNSVRGWVSRQTFSLTGHGSVFKPHTTDKQSVVYMLPAPLAEHLLVFVEVGIKAVPTFDVASLAVLPWGSIEASRAADIYAVSRYILTDQRRVVVDFSPCGLDERLIGADEIRIIKLVPHQAVLAIPERYMDPPLGSSRASCSAYYASELVVYEADQLCDLDLSDSPVRSPITCTCDKAADKSADKSVEATTACNADKPVTAKPVTAKSAVPPAFSWDSTNAQQTLDQAIAAWKQQLGALPDMLLDLTAISRSTEKPATDKSRLAASASWDSNDAQKTLEQVINAWRQQLDSLQDIFVDFNVVSYSAANLSFQWTGDNFSALMKWLRGCTFFDTERGVFKG
jgi:hypothetical protein